MWCLPPLILGCSAPRMVALHSPSILALPSCIPRLWGRSRRRCGALPTPAKVGLPRPSLRWWASPRPLPLTALASWPFPRTGALPGNRWHHCRRRSLLPPEQYRLDESLWVLAQAEMLRFTHLPPLRKTAASLICFALRTVAQIGPRWDFA